MKINRVKLQLNIEKFIKEQLWQMLIVFAFVFMCAWLFNKYVESVLFCISHTIIRMYFDKQYHCGTTALCMFTTLSVAFFGIASILPMSISLLSTIPICYLISWIGYIVQDRIDCLLVIKKLTSKTIWQMSENELVDYCYAKGVRGDMLEFVVMILIHEMKYEEIGNKLGYAVPTLKEWSKICKKKLGIQSWKN